MSTYVAFLRAINLGANRKVPMVQLRACLEEAGYEEVETHIQTGNVKLRATTRSAATVERELESLLSERFGFEVPAILFTPAQLRAVHDAAMALTPRTGVTGELRYVVLFKKGETPTAADRAAIDAWDEPGEAGTVVGRAAHIWIDGTSQNAKILKAFSKPLAPGTSRNLTVLTAVAEKWA